MGKLWCGRGCEWEEWLEGANALWRGVLHAEKARLAEQCEEAGTARRVSEAALAEA